MATYTTTVKNTSDGQTYTFTYGYTVSSPANSDKTTLTHDTLKVTRPKTSDEVMSVGGDLRVNNRYAGSMSGTMKKTETSKNFSNKYTVATITRTRSTQTISVQAWSEADADDDKKTYFNISVPAKPSYTVTYNANGGSGAPAAQTKWYGENLTLQSGEPTRTNYVFKNWNTKADGSGTTYNKGATYTANAALTLYAQWYAPYTVSYNANGGTGAPSSQTKVYNKSLTLTSTKPNKTDWKFKNWNTKADGSGTTYNSGASYTSNANATLYAQWERQISKVTIGSVDAKRVNDPSSTTESDEGTYAYLEIPFIVKGAAAADVSITATATAASGSAPTVTIDSDTATKVQDNDLIGTFIIRAGVCDIDVEYVFDITITAKNTSATQNDVIARRTVRLSTAFFTIDVLAGGHGIAFGKAAKTEDLFECEFPAQFNDVLNVNINMEMGLDTTEVPGTIDGDLYAAITALGWESEVID